jgi:hypothetical protein
MSYVISCPHCKQQVQLADNASGKQFRCPFCKAPFVAPAVNTSVGTEGVGRPVATPPSAQATLSPIMTWEYRTEDYGSSGPSQRDLNLLGAEGWELVSVAFWENGLQQRRRTYIFKRRLGQVLTENTNGPV